MKRARPPDANQLGLFDAPLPAVEPELPAIPPAPPTSPPVAAPPDFDADPFPAAEPPPAAVVLPLRPLSAPGETALRLESNLALMAGAGTGKTHSLVTLCLHLLGGARAGREPIPPHALGLLTFTDKAAAEMRLRLYTRLDALVRDPSCATEPDLKASYEALEKPLPPAGFWRGVRDGLGGAPIGTFHALCVQLLREAPPTRAFSPAFELLDEHQARDLLFDTADRVVLAAIERKDPHLSTLARIWQLSVGMGLSPSLISVLHRIREEGQVPDALPITDPELARRQFDEQLRVCRGELAKAEAKAARALKPEYVERAAGVRNALSGMTYENVGERLARVAAALGSTAFFPDLRESLFGGKKELGLANFAAGVRVVPFERAFRALLGELKTAWDAALRRRNALDFTGLLIEARDLLRDDLDARRLAQARFQALLVDELQDTNRLQLELLHLLGEQREGAPRATNPPLLGAPHAVLELPLEPAFLCVVGDRKQSIYEFRGADVSVVEQAARAIDASGGARAFLKTSRRSSPALISFFNRVLPRLMVDPRTQVLAPMQSGEALAASPSARSFEVSYVPAHDDLASHRTQDRGEPAVERYVGAPAKASADDLRYFDSRTLARRVRELLEQGQFQGRDVALLFRRFTFVEEYRQALLAEGVPHRVVRGRGFYGAQEVLDLAALLGVVADPSDAVSLAVVLRSPLVGFTDASLVRLARATGGRLDPARAMTLAELPAGLSGLERERLGGLQRLVAGLRAERHRLPLRAMLTTALEATRYREAMAATAFGPQVLANVEKLLELAARRDAQGPADCGNFARELQALADLDPLEAHADVIDDDDPHAVTLCTIHQAKGLEWPVVVLPELFSPMGIFGSRARYERDLGLALRSVETDLFDAATPRFEKAKKERRAREEADFKRVRYVAMTRARDLLILGVTKKGAAWADLDDACAGAPEVLERALQLPEPKAPMPRRGPAADLEAVTRAAERLATRPAPSAQRAMLPVTQLQDFALCPTRYRLLHLVGLSEFPSEPRELDLDGPVADVRERGTHVHRLLEKVPLQGPYDLEALERAEGLPADAQVREWVARYLATPFARGVKNAHRELPFVLRLEHQGFTLHLRGAIDLLVLGDDGVATVIDYKTSLRPKDGLDAYRFQLGCYVLATRALLGDVPIRAGIAFLREENPSPELLPPGPQVDAAWLAAQAHALVTAQVDGRWQGQTEARCRSLKCGYVYRCHPSARQL